jgi:uncharacterized tellurite resistance protein B-like protein
MFNIFKKQHAELKNIKKKPIFEIELTASVLAYEVARSDGSISKPELDLLLTEIEKIALNVGKSKEKIFKIVEKFSSESVSFYEFIESINDEYSKNEKLLLIDFLWRIAFADSILGVQEERLVRRIADLINIKDIDVLKLKDKAKNQRK